MDTGPEALPKLTISPKGFRQSSEVVKVSRPTLSYTTGTIAPPVICFTRAGMSSLVSSACSAPWARISSAFSGVENFNLGLLAPKGSLYVTRPTLNTYTAKREDLEATAAELFEVVKSGAVKIMVNQTYPLKDAAEAHRALEGRKTTGSTVLLPG